MDEEGRASPGTGQSPTECSQEAQPQQTLLAAPMKALLDHEARKGQGRTSAPDWPPLPRLGYILWAGGLLV